MEFEKFIETKMIEFLDKRASELADRANRLREEEFSMFEITSDYNKEISDALKGGNIIKAKQLLEEVKNKYVQAPDGTISKKRLYTIMEEIYERIKDFEEGSGDKSLLQTIREYEEKGLFAKPDLFKQKQDESMGIIISSITMKEKEIEEFTAKDNLTSEDVQRAVAKYRELKELVEKIPDSHDDLKNKASERALKLFYKVKRVKSDLSHPVNPNEEVDVEKEIQKLEDHLAEIRVLKENIVLTHQSIQSCLESKDLPGCIKSYRKLKKLCESFPKELSEERLALLAEALSVFEKIKAMKHELGGKKEEPVQYDAVMPAVPSMAAPDLPTPEQPIDHVQKIRDDIAVSERLIDEFLGHGEIKNAMKEYTNLKMLCRIFPKEDNPQEKVVVLSGALAAYEKIRKAKEAKEREDKARVSRAREEEASKLQFDAFRGELGMKINHVKEFLAQKDSQNAIKAYSELKAFFNNYPDEPLEQKRALYDDILSAHLDMALLDKDFKNKTAVESDAGIKDIRKVLSQAKELAGQGLVEDASHLALEVKHKTLMLPSEEFDVKYGLIKEIDELEHSIAFSRNMTGIDQAAGVAPK